MPKKPIDYSKCMFYRLVCRDTTVTECYVGHTTDESNRRRKHKSDCTNEKGAKYNLHVYRFIRDHGGFDNWQMLVEEKLAVADDVAARLRERFWCEHFKATLNSQVPGRTVAEYDADHVEEAAAYRAEHREDKAAYDTQYRADHLNELKIKKATYHAEHREALNKKSATYHAKHREAGNAKSAAWYAAHKAYLETKHDCPCGGKYTTSSKCKHYKTARHLAYLATL